MPSKINNTEHDAKKRGNDGTVDDNSRPDKQLKDISDQEKKQIEEQLKRQEVTIQHATHFLQCLARGGKKSQEVWAKPEVKEIREMITSIASRPDLFPPMMGDKQPDGSHFNEQDNIDDAKNLALTEGYVAALAEHKDLSYADSPILQVASKPEMNFEHNERDNKNSSIHFTHLCLCDGSKDVLVGRLPMHLAVEGKHLKVGDIIQLRMHTPLTYAPSAKDTSHRSPAVVIHTYSRVGYAVVPDKLNTPRHCKQFTDDEIKEYSRNEKESLAAAHTGNDDDEYEELVEVECTPENRYCSLYGVSTVVCICESDPVDKIDLEVVRENCYFATKTVDNMDPGNKRNMLYWWYMTNIYNICGKGKRREPPPCLLAAIRKCYPEPNGKYKIFKPGKK